MGLLDDAIKEHLELKRRRGADAGEISRLESEALGPVPRSAEGVPDMSDTFEPPRDEPAGEAAAAPAAPPPSGLAEDDATAAPAPAPAPADEFLPPPRPSEPPPPVLPPAVAPPPQSLAPPPVAEPRPPSSAPPAREPWMTEDPGPAPEPAFEPPPEPESEHGGLFSRLRGGRRSRHDAEPELPPAAHELAPQDLEGFGPPPTPRPSPGPPPGEHEPDIVPADDEPDGEELLEETPEFLEETPEHDRLWFEQRPPRDFNFDD